MSYNTSMQISTQIACVIIISCSTASWLYMMIALLKRYLHLLQLDDYQPVRMIRASWKSWAGSILALDLAGLIIYYIVSRGLLHDSAADTAHWYVIGLVLSSVSLWIAGTVIRGLRTNRKLKTAKKSLIMTSRAKRIFWVGLGLILATITLAFLVKRFFWFGITSEPGIAYSSTNRLILAVFVSMYFASCITPVWLSAAVLILHPVEKLIQQHYMKDAKRTLAEIRPMVIGITGSYGKTGTKEMLAAMLAEKYNVFRPPGSYNTLMGVTRVIREQLRPFHEVSVVEMGAYRIGSIEKLCRLVQPSHGIITIIGVQHLERFKSRAAIQHAKGELVRSLPQDGFAVLNGNDPLCVQIGDDFAGRIIYFGIDSESIDAPPSDQVDASKHPRVTASGIEIYADGSEFTLNFPDGDRSEVRIPLLGRGAIANATAAAAMADALEVPRRKIISVLTSLPQVRHRLEFIKGGNGVFIIDDAFNSNPVGASYALEVLSQSKTGRRILVTPGIVELGHLEEEANHSFGFQAASACDLVVLVGHERIKSIRNGLLEGGFDERNIWTVPTFKEGMVRLDDYTESGDTILLENDLPDQYEGK